MNISSETALRAVIGKAHPITLDKELDHIVRGARMSVHAATHQVLFRFSTTELY